MSDAFFPGAGDALAVVDVQNDFLPGGSLPVPGGDAVIAPLDYCLGLFQGLGLPIFATRDWHPERHCSFQSEGGPFPAHCRQGTAGARFADALIVPASAEIVSKAAERGRDAFSGFDGTGLKERLEALRVRRLFVGGLTAEYCVLETVKDARRAGFNVVLLEDAVRGLERREGDSKRAINEMAGYGAAVIRTERLGHGSLLQRAAR